jgi:hypothetical protein
MLAWPHMLHSSLLLLLLLLLLLHATVCCYKRRALTGRFRGGLCGIRYHSATSV